jgi:hypothetical protein
MRAAASCRTSLSVGWDKHNHRVIGALVEGGWNWRNMRDIILVDRWQLTWIDNIL